MDQDATRKAYEAGILEALELLHQLSPAMARRLDHEIRKMHREQEVHNGRRQAGLDAQHQEALRIGEAASAAILQNNEVEDEEAEWNDLLPMETPETHPHLHTDARQIEWTFAELQQYPKASVPLTAHNVRKVLLREQTVAFSKDGDVGKVVDEVWRMEDGQKARSAYPRYIGAGGSVPIEPLHVFMERGTTLQIPLPPKRDNEPEHRHKTLYTLHSNRDRQHQPGTYVSYDMLRAKPPARMTEPPRGYELRHSLGALFSAGELVWPYGWCDMNTVVTFRSLLQR